MQIKAVAGSTSYAVIVLQPVGGRVMFTIFRSKSKLADRRVIDCGRVGCPARGGDVGMDVCAACRWLAEIDEKADVPFVRCRPELPLSDPTRIVI